MPWEVTISITITYQICVVGDDGNVDIAQTINC